MLYRRDRASNIRIEVFVRVLFDGVFAVVRNLCEAWDLLDILMSVGGISRIYDVRFDVVKYWLVSRISAEVYGARSGFRCLIVSKLLLRKIFLCFMCFWNDLRVLCFTAITSCCLLSVFCLFR